MLFLYQCHDILSQTWCIRNKPPRRISLLCQRVPPPGKMNSRMRWTRWVRWAICINEALHLISTCILNSKLMKYLPHFNPLPTAQECTYNILAGVSHGRNRVFRPIAAKISMLQTTNPPHIARIAVPQVMGRYRCPIIGGNPKAWIRSLTGRACVVTVGVGMNAGATIGGAGIAVGGNG